jgi:hypothetical protein
MTLSTMMCIGNGCPERVYAYHRCDRGYLWNEKNHRCLRKTDKGKSGPVGKGKQSQTMS